MFGLLCIPRFGLVKMTTADNKIFRVKKRENFEVLANTRISSSSYFKLYLPSAVMEKRGALKDVVELSDDEIEVGLQESSYKPGKITAIIIFMRPGDQVRIGVATEVVIDCEPEEVEIMLSRPLSE